ncbi:MDR family MFS transporter [Fictibacillus enclensis]|uniref:MDR family MFS transporter n=1 Tax=Fictibacillus enclensis TaxID=1017270 RepID=UPI0024C07D9F|nr:MDR family MFS transporter [Fictibacillus enclensis]WHY74043.1 MDR family MFS transporter [Fictibacillus enclensis]
MVNQQRSKKFVVAGLLLGILMSAMDNTIVATAIGTIVAELGDFEKFIWVTSAYMIASVASMLIFGKLSDMYGRKKFYITGLALFILGSVLCGMADTMTQLSLYRAIQGVGGGALMPIAFTIIFDIFPVEQRGKMTGLFGAVFGMSSVFGPLLGAYLTDYLDWRWIFYVNLPLGLLSLFFIFKFYFESLEHREQKIDYLGAVLLVASLVSLMFALEFGGKEYAWDSALILSLLAGFAVLFVLFILAERRAADPIVSLALFKKRLFLSSQAIAFFYGSVFILATMYIPIYIQGVFGGSATNAGLILMPMMIGVVVGSQTGGRTVIRSSYRKVMMFSGVIFLIGVYLLSTMDAGTSRMLVTLYMVLAGIGVGFSFPVLSMASVHKLDARQRGSANSQNAFFRLIGMTLGITIFGTIQNNLLSDRLKDALPQFGQFQKSVNSRALLQPEVRKQIPPEVLDKMTDILANSIADTFGYSLICVVAALLFIFFMGQARVKESDESMSNGRVSEG